MTELRTGRRGGGSMGWSTRDLMVVAAIGVALGLALVPVEYVNITLDMATGPLGMALTWGVYMAPLLMVSRITHQPGAAFLAGFLVQLVRLPFSPGGWLLLLIMTLAGLACEFVFLLTRYRSFGLPTLAVAGAVTSLVSIAHMYLFIGFFELAPALQLALVVVPLLSGALLGAVPAKLLSDALAKTGVLSGYAISRETRGRKARGGQARNAARIGRLP